MGKQLRALIVEDSTADTQLLVRDLTKSGFDLTYERVETTESMNEALDRQSWDVILSDYVMPHFSGLAALELVKKRGIDVPFIIISGKIGEDIAVEAMRAGANDYILKGNLARLVPAIERELQEAVVRRERRQAQEERDRLMEQLREVNEKLVVTSIEMKEKVDEAEKSAAELDAILMSAAEAIIIYGQNGDVVRANPAAPKLLGLGPEDYPKRIAERMSLIGFKTPEGKPISLDETPVMRAFRGETIRGMISKVMVPGRREPVWVSASAAPVRGFGGKLVGVVAVYTDITALHEKRQSF